MILNKYIRVYVVCLSVEESDKDVFSFIFCDVFVWIFCFRGCVWGVY